MSEEEKSKNFSLEIPFFYNLDKSSLFWKEKDSLSNIKNLIYSVSNINEDLEVNLPLFIKRNKDLNTIEFIFDAIFDIDFDTSSLNDAFKFRNFLFIKLITEQNLFSSVDILETPKIVYFLESFEELMLEELEISQIPLNTQTLSKIANLSNLKRLNLNKIQFEKMIDIDFSFHLVDFSISTCNFYEDDDFYKFMASFKNLDNLKIYNIELELELKKLKDCLPSNLKSFLMDYQNCIDERDLKEIIPIVNDSIELYFLRNLNKIPIFQFFNKSLKRVKLNNQKMNLDGMDEFLKNNGNLKELSISFQQFTEISKKFLIGLYQNSLEVLKLSGIDLSDGLFFIKDKMTINISIKKLSLNYHMLYNNDGVYFAKYLSIYENLTYLDLSSNSISSKGFKEIMNVIPKLNNLKYLNLSGNQIEKDGGLILKEYLKLNTSLERLNVDYLKINDQDMTDILEGLILNTNLKSISLKNITPLKILKNHIELFFYNLSVIDFNNIQEFQHILKRNQGVIITSKMSYLIHLLDFHFSFQ